MRVHAGFLVVALLAAVLYPGHPVVYTIVTAAPVVTFLGARHLPDRWPWLVAAGGLAVLFGSQFVWPGWIGQGHVGRAEGSITDVTQLAAHGLFLVGAAAVLRRRARTDMGGIIDAGLFGLCAGGPLWQWVVEPTISDHASAAGQMLLLADLLTVCAVIGSLLRMGAVGRAGRGTIAYLTLTAVLTVAATVIDAVAPQHSVIAAEVMMLAYLTMAAAPIMPDARDLTVSPPPTRQPRRARLGWLGLALSINPAIAAMESARGNGSASLLLPIGTLLVIPLVVLRLRLLTAQRERAERTLAYHATHDELTGLVNRRHIAEEIDDALTEVRAGRLDEVTILLCDLDGFKPINDRYGHRAGDEVLRVVAQRLAGAVRDDDVVGRIGGDEFLVLCRAGDPRDRIAEALRAPITVPGAAEVTVGVTIGAAHGRPGTSLDRDVLIGRADTAMYAGKSARDQRTAGGRSRTTSSAALPQAR